MGERDRRNDGDGQGKRWKTTSERKEPVSPRKAAQAPGRDLEGWPQT